MYTHALIQELKNKNEAQNFKSALWGKKKYIYI